MSSIPSGTSRRHDPTTPEGRAHLARVRDEERDRARLLRHVGWAPGSDAVTLHERVHGCRYGVNATRRHLRELAEEGQVEERDGGWHISNGGRHASAGQLPAPGSVDTPPDPNPGQVDRSVESLAAPASPARPAPQEAARPDASEAACVSERVGVLPAMDERVLGYARREPGRWTVQTLAEHIGRSPNSVQQSVADLRRMGLLAPAYHDAVALRRTVPNASVPRVPDSTSRRIWRALVRPGGPWAYADLMTASGSCKSVVSRCVSFWRRQGAVSASGSLWPVNAGPGEEGGRNGLA